MIIKRRGGNKKRRAAAAVEMAVVTPFLLTMLFGIIEYGWVFTVRQAIVTAAREGARTASLPGSTDTEIYDRVDEFLEPLGLGAAEYNVELTRAVPGDPIEVVEVSVPWEDVTLIGNYFGTADYTLGARASMRKEGLD